MALYDRNYMRFDENRGQLSMWVILLAVNFGVFILQSIVKLASGAELVERFFAYSSDGFLTGLIWTPITYGFLHGSPLHLIFNMLFLFLFGRVVERDIGPRNLLWLYLAATLVGAIGYIIIHLGGGILLGASSAIFGIITVFCLMHAEEDLTFLLWFVLPVRIKPKYILYIMLGLQVLFLFSELSGASNVASSAHLGGILGGFLFHRMIIQPGRRLMPQSLQSLRRKPKVEAPAWAAKKPKRAAKRPRFRVNISDRRQLKGEVDRILDKINSQGFGSLNEEEKETLDKARDILSK